MRLIWFIIISIGLIGQAFSEEITEDYKAEAQWHYEMACDCLKKEDKNLTEAIRILHEIVDYYDPDHLQAYELLIKCYEELKDTDNLKSIQQRYTQRLQIQKEQKPKKDQITEYYTGGTETNQINELIQNLKLADAEKRYNAAEKLINKGDLVVFALIKALESNDLVLQGMACYILGKIGNNQAVEPLINLLKQGVPASKIASAKALGDIQDEKAIVELINALSDPYFNHYEGKYKIREAAADALSKYGEKALPKLIHSARSDNEATRWFSLEALQRMESIPQTATLTFINALIDKNDQVKLTAVKALGKIRDENSIPSLARTLKSNNANIRYFAVQSLSEINSKDCIMPLLGALNDEDTQVVNEAIKVLVKLGAKDAINPILVIAQDEKRPVTSRWYAIRAIGQLYLQEGMPILIKALSDENEWIRSAAATALNIPKTIEDKELLEKKKKALTSLGLKFALTSSATYEEARKASISKALKFLVVNQHEDGHFQSDIFPLGVTQLALLCLLKERINEEDPVVKKGIEYMLKHANPDGSYLSISEPEKIKCSYNTSLAIMVLSATENPMYKNLVEKSISWLLSIQDKDGGFGYVAGGRSDLSSTEFALMALDSGYKFLGRAKTDDVWIRALAYLTQQQNSDGGFGYIKEKGTVSYGSMGAAGLIGFLLCNLDTADIRAKNALHWISQNYTLNENPYGPAKWYEYYIHSLAFALELTKKETIIDSQGKVHYWYPEIVNKLIRMQDKEGFWVISQDCLFTTYFTQVLQIKPMPESIELKLENEN
ncbi:MAG: HEAT repeat domain-containing protein [bacterium]